MTTSLHGKALAWAHESLGKHEVPGGSNTGPFVIQCQRATDLQGTRWPWCAAWLRRAWQAIGVELPYRGASAYGMLDYYTKHLPAWVVPRAQWRTARPGAAVVFNIGAGHVAMLKKPIGPGARTVTTIGGNESDAVRETTRPLSVVRGIIDPPEKAPPPPAPRPPRFEVVTSASGKRKVVYVSGATAISKRLGKLLNRYGGLTITKKKA